MKLADATAALKMALHALDRGQPNVALAIGLLREIVGDDGTGAVQHAPSAARAVSIAEAAATLGFCPKTVRQKIARGEIPAIGRGRSQRVLIDEAVEAMRGGGKAAPAEVPVTDPSELAGREWARRRGALRVVGGE